MEQHLQEIREQQKNSWNKFSAGWKKWDDTMMDFLQPMGNEIIKLIEPRGDNIILDIASGTGEPGLTIASMLNGGKVVLTDLSEDMLGVARENADKKGVRNIETIVCDVSELPFADNSFDAISCRFGYMFFPDMLLATKEMFRVLKSGGRIAVSVWNVPEKNFWVTAFGGTINRIMDLPQPPPGAPGMFRCAKPGLMQDLFKEAGFKNTSDYEVTSILKCGTTDICWEIMTEVAAPFVSALNKADDNMKKKIKDEVYRVLNDKYADGNVNIDASALLIYGEK